MYLLSDFATMDAWQLRDTKASICYANSKEKTLRTVHPSAMSPPWLVKSALASDSLVSVATSCASHSRVGRSTSSASAAKSVRLPEVEELLVAKTLDHGVALFRTRSRHFLQTCPTRSQRQHCILLSICSMSSSCCVD